MLGLVQDRAAAKVTDKALCGQEQGAARGWAQKSGSFTLRREVTLWSSVWSQRGQSSAEGSGVSSLAGHPQAGEA